MIKKLFLPLLAVFAGYVASFAASSPSRSVTATVVNNSLAVAAGQTGQVAINLSSTTGDVSSVAFTLEFDPLVLEYSARSNGADVGSAAIVPNVTNKANGKLTFIIGFNTPDDNTGVLPTFSSGSKQLLLLSFKVLSTTGVSTAIRFTDNPTIRSASSAVGTPLDITYTDSSSVSAGTGGSGTSATAPSISTQPQSLTVTAGASATFSVVAAGTTPLTYQWAKGTTNIANATNESYTISSASSTDAGSYTVKVSNSAGSVTSNAATLTVNSPPPVINSASTATATVGETFSYQITASDPGASFAATNLPAGLSLNQLSGVIGGVPTAAGTRQVSIVASNSGGNSPTFTLALTVNPRPLTVTLQGSVAKVYDGTDAAFVGATNYQISGLLPSDAITISKSSGKYNSAAAGGTLMDVEGVVRSWSMDGTKLGAFVNGNQYYVWTRITAGLGQYAQSPTPPPSWGKALNISGFTSLSGETGVTFKFGDLFLNQSAFISGKDGVNGGITVQEYVPQSGVATPVAFYDTAGVLLASGTMEKLVTRVVYTTGIATGEGRFTLNAAGTSAKSAAFMQELAQVTGGTGRLNFFISSYVAITGNSDYADYRSTGAISSAAATGKTVTVSLAPGDFTAGQGTSLANYTLPQDPVSGAVGVILKAPLTAKADNKIKRLGAANPPLTITYAGFVNGETKAAITEPSIGTSATADSPLGDYGITLTGGSAANYSLTLQNGVLSVVAKTVPVIDWVPTGPIVYGTALGPTQLNAVAKTPEGASLQGTLVYTPASGAVLNAGSQTLSVTFTPTDGDQYATATLTNTLSVSRKSLTLALKGTVTKVYDGTAAATLAAANYDLAGFAGSESATVTKTLGAYDNANAGTGKSVSVTSLGAQDFSPSQGTTLANYTLPTSAAGPIGEVSRKLLSAQVQGPVLKPYDGTTAASLTAANYVLAGVINGESATVNQSAAAFDTAAAGTGKTVTATLAASNFVAGANTVLTNYTLPESATGAVGVIEKKAVAGSFTAVNKVYDGLVAATVGERIVTGAVQGDDVSLSGGTASFGSAAAGAGKTVTLSGASLSGNKASNYALSAVAPTTANITPKQLTVTGLSAASKPYDGSAAAVVSGTAVLSGAVSGDDVGLAGTASAAFANSNAGTGKTVAVSGLSLSGAAKDNYTLAPVSLTADIAKVPLTVKAEDRSKGYDGQIFASSGHAVIFTGFIPGETAAVLVGSLNFGGGAATATNAGQHAITPGGLTSANYAITFIDGALTINRRPLTIRANDDSKVYGTVKSYGTSIAFSSQGLVSGQSIGSVTITPSGGATAASPAGTYDLVPTAAAGGTFRATNYDITYQKGSLVVSSFTVTGNFVAANKTYDGTTNAAVASRSLTGVRSGDVVELIGGTAAFESPGVGSGKRVVLTGAILTGANAGNYVLSAVNSSSANITAKELTIVGLSASNKTYDGTSVATITGTPLLQGKVTGDVVDLSGTPAGAFASAGAGSAKAIIVSGLGLAGTSAGNYSLASPSLTADIAKADQSLTIVSALKRAASDPDFTLDVAASSKLKNFTYASSVPAVATVSSAGVIDLLTQGTTAITVTQPGDTNFNSASVTGTLSVVASGQTLVWDVSGLSGKKFGDAPITLSATASSNLPVTFTSLNPTVVSISGNTLTINGAGTADIIAVQAGDANFGAAERKVLMTVAKAAATVSLSGLSATYDGSPKAATAVSTPSGLKVNILYGAAPGSATAPTNAGTYPISATVDENNYSGGDASKTLVISKAAQTISSFGALAAKSVVDAAFNLAAVASSGLPVSYTSSNPLVASVVGSVVTPRAAGSVTITARQAGNENYNAAADVTQSLVVEPLPPEFSIPAASAEAIQGSFFLFGPVSLNRLSAPATFSVSANLPAGLKIDSASGNISGVPTSSSETPVVVTITATNSKTSTSKNVSILVKPPAPVITSAAAYVATAGTLFKYQTVVTPSAGVTYSISPASAPAGWSSLSISGTGELSGTALVGGTFVITITVTNATGSASLPLAVTVNLPADAPAYTGVSNPSGTAGTSFSFTPNFGTSVQTTAYSISGTLPTGLSFSTSTGVISGTTQVAGTFPISITATRGGLSATANLSLVINPPANAPVAIVTGGNVRTGTVGTLFSVTVTGDPLPTGFTIDETALANAGLSATGLASATATISGTPTKVGTFSIPIVARNLTGSGPATDLVLTVNPHPDAPQVVSTPSVTARVGVPFTPFVLSAKSAGTDIVPPAVTFAMLGNLPAGLGFDGSTGVISGQPASGTAGEYKVVFSATKVGTPGATGLGLEVSLIVLPPLTVPEITSNGSAAGQVGQPFSYAITATNVPTAYTAAPLPAGLSLSGGVISGVPTSATGSTPFSVTLAASNGDGAGNPKTLLISLASAPATPVVTSALSATGRVGSPFSYKIDANESPTSYVALNLPRGLAVTVGTGQILGSPTQAGTFVATIRAANAAGLGAAESLTISVSPALSAPAILSAPTALGEVGVQSSYQITATNAPTSYSVAGNLPPGLALNPTTGLIKGSPTQSGTFAVAVVATGGGGSSLPQSVLFTIKPSALAPLVTSPGTASGNVGSPFSYQIQATNPPLVTQDAVNLPPGLAVNPFTGQITGTPTTVGTTVASLVATNSAGGTGPIRDLTIVIGPSLSAPVIFGAKSVSGQVGVSFSYGITASETPTSYELSGAPAWMLLNTATGVITGTPTAPGSFAVSAVARNAAGASAPHPMTVSIAPAANTPVITSSQTASGTVGVAFVKYTIASNPLATSYLASGLPPGLSLNGTLGEITGTPTASGSFPVSISGTNSNGQGATVKVTISINPSITFSN